MGYKRFVLSVMEKKGTDAAGESSMPPFSTTRTVSGVVRAAQRSNGRKQTRPVLREAVGNDQAREAPAGNHVVEGLVLHCAEGDTLAPSWCWDGASTKDEERQREKEHGDCRGVETEDSWQGEEHAFYRRQSTSATAGGRQLDTFLLFIRVYWGEQQSGAKGRRSSASTGAGWRSVAEGLPVQAHQHPWLLLRAR